MKQIYSVLGVSPVTRYSLVVKCIRSKKTTIKVYMIASVIIDKLNREIKYIYMRMG